MRNRSVILLALCLAAFIINLDTTIVNVALPTLSRELHATTSQLQWVVDAYNLVFAALLLVSGNLSDRFGRKGMLVAGLGVFALASAAGGLTTSAGQLIAARGVMGLGAAMIFPATLSLISNTFTERGERAKAIGLWGATTGVAIALGPIVGGWLLEHFSWNSIFFTMTPVAAVIALIAALSVQTSRDVSAPPVDWRGLVLSTSAVAILIYTIIEGPTRGWASGRSITGFVLSVLLIVALVVSERRSDSPMLDISLFRNPRFSAASGSVTVAFFAISGFSFLITQYFQLFKHYSPFSAGVHLLPVAISVGAASVIGTQLAVRFGTKAVVTTGLFFATVFFVWVSTLSSATSYWQIALQMVLGGTGIGLTSAPATQSIMAVVPSAKAGVGSAINDTTRLIGATLGVAIVGSVYASLYNSRLTQRLPAVPSAVAHAAHSSVGAAIQIAKQTDNTGHPVLAAQIHQATSSAFFHGFSAGCLVAAGVAAIGAFAAFALLPAKRTHLPVDVLKASLQTAGVTEQ
ncbi:MAG TPA: MFS transporter [Acidimicrobiales bacterium]|nr:MFS transporter [Acidimicrobiales bacterium]